MGGSGEVLPKKCGVRGVGGGVKRGLRGDLFNELWGGEGGRRGYGRYRGGMGGCGTALKGYLLMLHWPELLEQLLIARRILGNLDV